MSKDQQKVDVLIVGQGLAGSALALQLIYRGKKVMVIDQPANNRSSRVAAGLFNPVTGMGIVKTWMEEPVFSYLHEFYAEAEKFLNEKFFFTQLLYRPFGTIEEQNNWMAKSTDPTVSNLMADVFTTSHFSNQVHDPFGGLLIKNAGYIDSPAFLKAVQSYLIANQSYWESHFNSNELVLNNEGISYQHIVADYTVMCTGINSLAPFFDWLPIRSLKGETLTISMKESPEMLLNKGVYVVPTDQLNLYKAGATYSLKELSPATTIEGENEIKEKLGALLKTPFEIVGQDWGIRPTTVDRKPILGSHPVHPKLVIFNGLGTKGVSLAPYFSNQLANWLLEKDEIIKEVNINRFKPLYSKS